MKSQLEQYILTCLEKGVPHQVIKTKLLEAGWKQEDIDSALASSDSKQKKTLFIFNPSFLIRVGLSFVYMYAAINFYFNPGSGMHYLPQFVSAVIPAEIFLHTFEAFEITLSLWLLSGKVSRYSGLVAAIVLVCITALNIESLSILFRNVAIIFAALALAVMPKKK